ncbi:carbon-nitrogen hydrolase family protein, partial [Mycobacterium sp. CBMA295]|nr:carbon-nitrogen hydrolase family protein [Mycolicibacterium sp. CBMA 295]
FYVGGDDDGVIDAGGYHVGAAVCWELMRTRTVRRLQGRVDLLMTGSGWWSIPRWQPHALFDSLEHRNRLTARTAAASFSKYVGAPCVHAGHAGELHCSMPWLPVKYRGHFEGSTMITTASGEIIAERRADEGQGVALGEITVGRQDISLQPPTSYWLHSRGLLPSAVWNYQRLHGRRWYRRNVAGTRSGAEA